MSVIFRDSFINGIDYVNFPQLLIEHRKFSIYSFIFYTIEIECLQWRMCIELRNGKRKVGNEIQALRKWRIKESRKHISSCKPPVDPSG